jgi:ketosteroid isomerase-like protein
MTVEERIRGLYERFARGDIDEAVEMIDPDIVVVDAPELPGGRTYRGRAEVAGALRELYEMFDGPTVDIQDLRIGPERAVALLRVHGRGQGGGVPIDADIAHVFRMRDDSIVEMLVFLDHPAALAEGGFQSE